jgi:MFS family permease
MNTEKSEQISRSLHYSLADGFFWSVMVGFGESFFAAFGVFLNASNPMLGLLGSLPNTLGSVAQLGTRKLMALFKSRKKVVCAGALLQGLMYLPIAAVFLTGGISPFLLLLFVCLYHIFGMIFTPAWNSWMGDLVCPEIRGTFFGKRNLINGFTSFLSLFAAGFILQKFSREGHDYTGYLIIFGLALFARLASFLALSQKFDPPWDFHEESTQSFKDFLKNDLNSNFGILSFYLSMMSFAVYLSAPFFAPFMLRELNLDYSTYTLITATAVVAKCFSMPIWGKIVDRHGGRRVLSICGWGLPLSTLLWVFYHEIWYLVIAQLYCGWCWAGYEISSFSLMYDNTDHKNRATLISYYNVMNGVAIIAGSLIGGLIVKYTDLFNSKYLLIFAISGFVRGLVSMKLLKSIKEIRSVENISKRGLILRMISPVVNRGMIFSPVTFWRKK